jgi:hypothetical protein
MRRECTWTLCISTIDHSRSWCNGQSSGPPLIHTTWGMKSLWMKLIQYHTNHGITRIVHLLEIHRNTTSHSHVSCHTVCQRPFLRRCKEVTIHFFHNFVLIVVIFVTSASTWKTISSAYSCTSYPHIHTSPSTQCLVSLTLQDRVCHAFEMNTQ